MFQNPFAGFIRQVQTVERAVALLQFIDNAQALQIVLKTAERAHAFVQRILPRVTERRVSQVVRERNGLDQILIQPQIARQRAGDLRHFHAVREARAKQIAFVIDEHLRFVLQSAK